MTWVLHQSPGEQWGNYTTDVRRRQAMAEGLTTLQAMKRSVGCSMPRLNVTLSDSTSLGIT